MRILLVEDDAMIGEAVSVALGNSAYAVDWVGDGATANKVLQDSEHQAVLLNPGLPARDGRRKCRRKPPCQSGSKSRNRESRSSVCQATRGRIGSAPICGASFTPCPPAPGFFACLSRTPLPGERTVVTQPTDARDEIAVNSALYTLIPLSLLVPLPTALLVRTVRRELVFRYRQDRQQ